MINLRRAYFTTLYLLAFGALACGTATNGSGTVEQSGTPQDLKGNPGDAGSDAMAAGNGSASGEIPPPPFFQSPNKKAPEFTASGGDCASDADCVPVGCCHPKYCVDRSRKPDCGGVMCTLDCRGGAMDCGAGSCICSGGQCAVKWNPDKRIPPSDLYEKSPHADPAPLAE